jgi:hypothetical protein
MTQTAAIAYALLKGEIISIKTAFDQFGCSNAPREIGRSIERKFGIQVSRHKVNFKSRYGKAGIYFQYRLNKDASYNKEGIEKMRQYVHDHYQEISSKKHIPQPELF